MRALKLRRLITAAVMASFLPGLSWAGNLQDDIVRELASQGFKHVKITTTWLGRMRFVATSDGQTREIIINGNTGEILRDYWGGRDDDNTPAPRLVETGNSGGHSNAGGNSGTHNNDHSSASNDADLRLDNNVTVTISGNDGNSHGNSGKDDDDHGKDHDDDDEDKDDDDKDHGKNEDDD
ncbi:MAG: hypothetical protein P8X77_03170 [Maritimibacter sp.]